MATQKQIEANRANSKRSTGPRTLAGKKRSSANSYRHGLSLGLQTDEATIEKVEGMVREIAGPRASEECIAAATDFAVGHREVQRVREVRDKMLLSMDHIRADPEELTRLIRLGRYDYRATAKRRRASRTLRRLLGTEAPRT